MIMTQLLLSVYFHIHVILPSDAYALDTALLNNHKNKKIGELVLWACSRDFIRLTTSREAAMKVQHQCAEFF
jgi:hypothetical protein